MNITFSEFEKLIKNKTIKITQSKIYYTPFKKRATSEFGGYTDFAIRKGFFIIKDRHDRRYGKRIEHSFKHTDKIKYYHEGNLFLFKIKFNQHKIILNLYGYWKDHIIANINEAINLFVY